MDDAKSVTEGRTNEPLLSCSLLRTRRRFRQDCRPGPLLADVFTRPLEIPHYCSYYLLGPVDCDQGAPLHSPRFVLRRDMCFLTDQYD